MADSFLKLPIILSCWIFTKYPECPRKDVGQDQKLLLSQRPWDQEEGCEHPQGET